jgi:hypothetical protein
VIDLKAEVARLPRAINLLHAADVLALVERVSAEVRAEAEHSFKIELSDIVTAVQKSEREASQERLKSEMKTLEAEFKGIVERAIAKALDEGSRHALATVVEIVRTQPFHVDTKVGMRQQWVKDQIVARIEELTK